MEIKIKKLEKGVFELLVELSSSEFDIFYQKVEKKLLDEFETAGFRRGKAPKEIFAREVGQSKIYREASSLAIEQTMAEALAKEKIEAVGVPKIEIVKVSLGNPFIYKIIVSILPKVKIVSFKKIEVKRKKSEITDQEVEKFINEIRERRKKEISKEKEAIRGDKVEMDIEMFFGIVPVENGQAQKVSYILGKKSWLPDIEINLIGVKRGEKKEFLVNYPVDYFDKKLAGKEVNFKIKINGVYEIELPKLDDEFVKSLGSFKDLEDFKKRLQENILEEKKLKNEELVEIEMLDQLVAQSVFEEIPDILIEEEKEKMIKELERNITEQNLKFEDYLNHLKKTRDELKKDLASQADKRIKTILIFRELIKQNKIDISEKEIDQQVESIVNFYVHDENLQQQIKSKEHRHHLANTLLNRKVIDFIKSQVKIIEK